MHKKDPNIKGSVKKLILRNHQSPGDIVMLTAAVRDLHRCYPGRFVTDVRTPCPELWENNPHLTPLDEGDPEVEVIACHYPLIHESNRRRVHFLNGFIEFLNDRLSLRIRLSERRGDIHLSAKEKRAPSPVAQLCGGNVPYWIVAAGGKWDYTIKWWDIARWQAVVDHFAGRVLFVQVGECGHYHPKLRGALDVRGRTSPRMLVNLVHHAQGILCPVTLLQHLAAAVPVRSGGKGERPCVVVAGGREPLRWITYPNHRILHTIGSLPCCKDGGCWRSRTAPIGDGDAKDAEHSLCVRPVRISNGPTDRAFSAENMVSWIHAGFSPAPHLLPDCMDRIPAKDVTDAMEEYVAKKEARYLKKPEARLATTGIARMEKRIAGEKASWKMAGQTSSARRPSSTDMALAAAYREKAEASLASVPSYPSRRFAGRGIVICAGGAKYFPCAWVCIKMLRHLGCELPIELWHLGRREMTAPMHSLVRPLGVRCVDATAVRRKHPVRTLKGWELKPYALLHSRFAEVLLLDADNVPVHNPEFLFGTPEFKKAGAIFWPDFGRLESHRAIWDICGIEYRDEPEVESGQIVVDKQRCWRALHLTVHFNEHSDFYYQHIYGDKETFHLAWRKLGQSYAMPSRGVVRLRGTMCQHDFSGQRLFQHRNMDKWRLHPRNERVPGFRHEAECLAFLRELDERWSPPPPGFQRWNPAGADKALRAAAAELVATPFMYHRVGYDHRPVRLLENGIVGEGAGASEPYWNVVKTKEGLTLGIGTPDGCTCRLRQGRDGVWRGRWLRFERMPVELTPQPESVGRPPLVKDEGGGIKEEGKARGRKQAAADGKFPSSLSLPPSSFSSRFPRLIHQIWLGTAPLPEHFRAWSEGWRRHHPGWHHQVWGDAEAGAFPMVNRATFDAAGNLAMKADIFRYELLLRHGGLYADMDFECLRPLDPLLEQVGGEAFAGFE